MTQLSLALDAPRLAKQLRAVREELLAAEPGEYLTFGEIANRAEMRPTQAASISARLRELRHIRYTVNKRRRGLPEDGLFEYRLEGHEC